MKTPSTPALRWLREQGIPHTVHTYRWSPPGGALASATALGRPVHTVVKTLVFETNDKAPLVVLMHGDKEVSTKQLARVLGVKSIGPCSVSTAERHSGYRVGGTSPMGLRAVLPLYVERSIFELPSILVNGGARGVLVELDPQALMALAPTLVDVAL